MEGRATGSRLRAPARPERGAISFRASGRPNDLPRTARDLAQPSADGHATFRMQPAGPVVTQLEGAATERPRARTDEQRPVGRRLDPEQPQEGEQRLAVAVQVV